ncbi:MULTISPECIES: mechanosensitive ion channel family protein [Kordiimonas]|jgi:small-conductance mechanosensitive channel|uniref:Mechanosensitive ion channel n=1 Tax=Kordiimonas lacus TaxID=637679 RepID=A0A1G7AXL4_9PROT|nr:MULTISPECIES: mechanosensitive ion channel domain-containing protein [Kordiimonas]SDE19533.1 Mechanosensitive ion channel [Kordiimonas lacus]
MTVLKSIFRPRTVTAKGFVLIALSSLIAASYLGYLAPVEQLLDSEKLTFRFIDFTVSPYKILKAMTVIIVFMWLASVSVDQFEKRVGKITSVRASNRELITKAATLIVYFLATVLALDVMGIDLTALTVIGGAIGIGIGFGLQKITSNFISGVILLAEKSVELDDLVELTDGTQGFVRHSGARYTLVETFDGKEVMVPNEDFITNKVINWTLTNTKGRVEITVGVAYGSDLDKVKELLLEAASEHPRCSADPKPQCFLDAFGDSSINFSVYFWVDDVTEGRREPKSDVQFAIWRKFQAAGVEIPFPQRDLHIKSGALPAEAKA